MTMRRSSNVLKSVLVSGALIAAALTVGCTTGNSSYDKAREYQENPSPELDTLHERRIDMDNQISVTNDENLRMLNEDLGRFFLLDRQSRLTPAPVPR